MQECVEITTKKANRNALNEKYYLKWTANCLGPAEDQRQLKD